MFIRTALVSCTQILYTSLKSNLFCYQEKIKKLIESGGAGAVVAGKGKKGGQAAAAAVSNGTDMKDFRTEYAKSGGSKCGACEDKIPKGHVRIGKKEYDSTRAKMYGPYDK